MALSFSLQLTDEFNLIHRLIMWLWVVTLCYSCHNRSNHYLLEFLY